MSSQYASPANANSPSPTRRGHTSRSIETLRSGGMRSSTRRSRTYAPALMRLVSIESAVGFSTNSRMECSSFVRTSPYAVGSSTGTSASVPTAPASTCRAICAVRSMSVRTSPLSMRKRSSSRSSAYLSAPAVPRGSGSSMKRRRTPNCEPSPRTLRTLVARKPHDMITSSPPWRRSHSSMYARNGRSTSGRTGFGTVAVSGRSRVPSPPTRITACTAGSSPLPDALVEQAGRAHGLRVERVAPVDEHRARHRVGDPGEVELLELVPLRHEHDGIGAAHASERVVGEVEARHQPPRLILGDRVVGAHVRARGLQPRAEHERGRLAHVVGVRLERQAEQRDALADERAEVLLQLADHAPLLELVDLDDRVEQLEVVAGVAGELLEGGDILGKTASAEPDPRLQELRPDPVVQADALRDLGHVRPGDLAHVRDLVDERDLRR